MPKKLFPHDLLAQTKLVLAGLKTIESAPLFGPLNAGALTAEMDQIYDVETQIKSLKLQLVELQIQRESLCLSAWDRVKRIRFGIKGLYGDDSIEYRLVGGTRVSERKRWTRRQVQTQD